MSEPRPFEQHLAASWPPERWSDLTVLVAVSGGADSVALLRGLAAIRRTGRGRLVVGHFNHRLRGEAADADERFVVALAEELGLECPVGRSEQPALRAAGDGLEAAARAERYAFLQSSAEQLGARYVATAHTANDQAETILHHILRGTGLAGLAGMRRARPLGSATTLMRPLLDTSRGDVLEYLASLGQAFREDLSNSDRRFTRNRLRHELLPLLEREYVPGVVESLLRLGNLATDAGHVIERLVAQLAERTIVAQEASSVTVDCQAVAGQDRHLVRELLLDIWRRQSWPLQAMGYAEWNQLADMALGGTDGTRMFPGAVRVVRQGERLTMEQGTAKVVSRPP